MSSKRQQQRNEKQLHDLIAKVPGNNQCADCRARNPGWASWSLGIFLCLRCAAIHRKLGTHISKVKSISLDTWTNEQVDLMKRTGNVTSNATWNPDPIKHPAPVDLEDSESIMERYIRDKYEHGKFRADRQQQQGSGRLLTPSSGVVKRDPSPSAPRSRDGNPRSSSPFESKGSKILGMNGSGSVSIPPEYEAKVIKLRDMGFGDEKQNAQVLKHTKGNMERAVEVLISMGGGTTSPVPPPKDKPVIRKQRSGLMLGGVKESQVSGGNPFDALDQAEAQQQALQAQQQMQQAQQSQQQALQAQQQAQQQFLQQQAQAQQQAQMQIHAPQPQQLFTNGQNGILQNGVQNGLNPAAAYNPFLQPQTTGYQQQQPVQQQMQQPAQQQQPQVFMNGNGQWAQNVQNPFQQAMFQQQQQLATPLASPWGDVPPQPQPQYATSHFTGSSASQQSPVSATNPFFAGVQTNPYISQQQQPFQQTFTPPLQQTNTNGSLPVIFQPSPQSPFQDPNQVFLQQQQQQQQFSLQPLQQQHSGLAPAAQPLMPQLTGRADKSTILQLYNYPQLAPAPSSVQQSVPGLPTQQRSVSTPVFQNSGSNNPFAAKMNGPSAVPSPTIVQDTFKRGHMTQESVDFRGLQNGRHSPDAFASLSASAVFGRQR
ncbi:hypothetical protein TWF718_010254 [Orbilia javanica]|uniref:ArfGap-domain-containing protein n=1 Tax=Orbilia javanica TaxID=47235 RepID=A0AAN8NPC1_9PEZI